MPKLRIIFFFLAHSLTSYGQSPVFTQVIGCEGDESINKLAIDKNNNILLSGTFNCEALVFDSIHTMYNGVKEDINNAFVLKYNASNEYVNEVQGWSSDGGMPAIVASPGNNNRTNLAFTFTQKDAYINNDLVTKKQNNAAFILMSIDSLGNKIWGHKGESMYPAVRDIITGKSGDSYIAGIANGLQLDDSIKIAGNGTDGPGYVYTMKTKENGDIAWVKTIKGGQYVLSTRAIAVSTNEEYIVIAGLFDAGKLGISKDTLKASGIDASLFIAALDRNGDPLWGKGAIAADGDHRCTSVAIDNNGIIYAAGDYKGEHLKFFDTVLHSNQRLQKKNIFIISYTNDGSWRWAKTIYGKQEQSITATATDDNGNLIITGSFMSDTLRLDSIILTKKDTTTTNGFLAIMNSNGKCIYAAQVDGARSENVTALATKDNIIYIGGSFNSDSIKIGNSRLYHKYDKDIFLVKFINPFVKTTSIQKVHLEAASVYPNPVNGQNFSIVMPAKKVIQSVKVYAIDGKEINSFSMTVDSNRVYFSLNERLAKGLYFVKLCTDEEVFTNKIIVN